MANEAPFEYSEENQEALFRGVYAGAFTAFNLPKRLYFGTANAIKAGLYKGYGGTLAEFEFGTPDYRLIEQLRNNVYLFSGAKTFTQVEHLKSLIYEDNKLLDYDTFKKRALNTYRTYNEAYLETEYVTALTSGRSANNFEDAITNKKQFPYLKYYAVLDGATAEQCRKLDGVTVATDSPFWNTHTPPNHFNCRCHVELISKYDDDKPTEAGKVAEISEFATKHTQPIFRMNPAKDGYIYKETGKDKHPYFIVQPKYQAALERNFNLPIPKKDI